MNAELDHLFICTATGAPEAEALIKLGLTEGQSNSHPGQGTACRRFFLRNVYLELLWVHDEREARGEVASPLRLWERWQYRRTGCSPFGIGLRPSGRAETADGPPFEAWEYRPPYLPASLHINIAENSSHPAEPSLFHIPFAGRPDASAPERRQPLEHALGLEEVTALRISLPVRELSKALEGIEAMGLAEFIRGEPHLLEIVFDGGVQGEAADLRPEMPLVLHW